jgi:hypothetical protein
MKKLNCTVLLLLLIYYNYYYYLSTLYKSYKNLQFTRFRVLGSLAEHYLFTEWYIFTRDTMMP